MARLYILCSLLLCWGFNPQLHAQNTSACLPGETCDDAPLFCGYALNNFTAELPLVPTNFGTTFGCSTEIAWHNSHWFRIIPCEPHLQLSFEVLNSQTGDGIQIALYHGCNDLNVVACDPGQQSGAFFGPLVLYANVVPGVEYLLQVDGFDADVCDYQVTVQSGLDIEQPVAPGNAAQNGYIEGPSVVCAGGGPYKYTAHLPVCTGGQGGCNATEQACTRYNWNVPPGATILGDATHAQITLDFSNATSAAISFSTYNICNWCQDCVPAGGGCNGVIEPKDITVIQPQTYHWGVIQICAGETYEACGTTFDTTGSYTIICPNSSGCGDTIDFTLIYNPACAPTTPCDHLNQPAAAGDSCSVAPLFCGNYLEGYCSSNAGASPDSSFNTNGAPCFSIENNVWLRIPPCSADVKLEITPVNCSTWNGLEAALFSGVCDSMNLVGNCQTLPPNQADTLIFNGLDSGEIYWLMIDGVQGDECQFSVHVVDGIGTGVVTGVSCNCAPGSISGPTSLCPGDVANYTVSAPDCSLSISNITGGNGMVCSPPADACGVQHDSTAIIWHIPDVMYFIGDSTGLSVQVGVDSNLIGIETLQMDSIWVEFKTFVSSDNTQTDSSAFCDCLTATCSSIVTPLHITIQHHIIQDFGISLTCNMPTVVLNNQIISAPGTYIVAQNHCETHLVVVEADFNIPFFSTNIIDNHDGTYTVAVNYFEPFYDVLGLPGTPGFNSFTSFPINCGTPYSFVVINTQSGCLQPSSGTYNCFCNPPMQVTLQKTGDLDCCTLSVPIEATTFPSSAGFYYNWNGPGMSGLAGNAIMASEPGQYAVTVTNLDGCTATGTIEVLADFNTPPASISPDQSICEGQTAALNASSTLPAAVFKWNNGNTGPNISINPSITTTYTVIVTNPDNCCQNTMSATVNVNNQPQINALLETCNPSGTAYVVSFQMTGQAPFLVNDVPVTGNNFSSSPVSSGDAYAFIVKSAPSGCETTQTGQHNCDFACVATAGQMDPTTLHVCVESSAKGHYLGGAQFGPNDIAQFVLHDLSGTNLGFVIAQNETGIFGFLPGQIQTEKTYYISQMVGESDGSGNIDLSDPCLSVAAGQPIVFHAAPEALVSGSTTVCPEQSFSLSGSGATEGFWILPGNQMFNGNALNLTTAEVDHLFDYQYVARNTYNCADTVHLELSVWAALEKPDYVVQNPPCADLTPVQGAVQISSPAAGLQFSLDAAAYLQTGRFEQLNPGLHTLRAQDTNGCTRLDSIYIKAPDPLLLDLGPDLTAHPGEQVQLKGVSNEVPVDIQWVASDGQTFSGDFQWVAQFSANSLVSLNMTDQNGCTAQDELWINIKADEHFYIPNALAPESAEANRYFTVFCADGYVKNIAALRVFDRWGNMVFERNRFQPNIPNLGWDGSTGGKYALPGAYVYIVELDLFDGTHKTLNGSLTVVR